MRSQGERETVPPGRVRQRTRFGSTPVPDESDMARFRRVQRLICWLASVTALSQSQPSVDPNTLLVLAAKRTEEAMDRQRRFACDATIVREFHRTESGFEKSTGDIRRSQLRSLLEQNPQTSHMHLRRHSALTRSVADREAILGALHGPSGATAGARSIAYRSSINSRCGLPAFLRA